MNTEACTNNRINIRLSYVISFVLSAITMTIVLYMANLILGEYRLVKGDVMFNYIPAIRNLCRDIIEGSDISFTWTYDMGINTTLLNAYYSYSPFNLLFLIFYDADMNVITALSIIIKTGLAAACFTLFVQKSYEVDSKYAVLISLFYSLSSYQIAYNIHNIIWLDAMYVLPLIFYSIDRLIEEQKTSYTTLWYAYIFAVQFYMGYMIGLAGTIYFLVRLFVIKRSFREVLGKLKQYFLATFLAIGLSAIAWLPALMFLVNNSEAGLTNFLSLRCNMLDVVNQLFWGEVTSFDAIFPYIYSGMPVLIYAPLFLFDKNNGRRERVGFGFFLGILVVSCIWLPMYALWHGFDCPDSYYFRFSYVLSFVLCLMAVLELNRTKRLQIKTGFRVLFVWVTIYLVEMLWQNKRIDCDLVSNTKFFFMINMALILGWLLLSMMASSERIAIKAAIMAVAALLGIAEIVSNGYVLLEYKGKLGLAMTREAYDEWDRLQQIVLTELSKDDGLYRVNSLQDYNMSTGIYNGYNSMSFFCSAENVKLRKTLSSLGMWSTPRMIAGTGLNPVSKMLFGVKYDVYNAVPSGEDAYSLQILPNDYYLGVGFLVDDRLRECDIVGNDPFENLNDVVTKCIGSPVNLFERVKWDDVEIINKGIDTTISDKGVRFHKSIDSKEAYVRFLLQDNGQETYYAAVAKENSEYNPKTFSIRDDEVNNIRSNGSLDVSCIVSMLRGEDCIYLDIEGGEYDETKEIDDIYFYKLDTQRLQEVYETLYDKQFVTQDWNDGYVRGYVETTKDAELLYTSIPYDTGWSVYVDGRISDKVPLIDDTFIGVDIEGIGMHLVEFEYRAPGENIGIVISIISFGTFLIMIYKQNIKNLNITLKKIKNIR